MKNLQMSIEQYANDSRLTEPTGKDKYDFRKIIELVKRLNRPLTETEAKKYLL